MQIMPPSVKSTVKDSTPQSGRVSKRRMFSLVATAAVASGLGITLGSTLRFQVLPVGQTPLFKAQQDFPPLAEWPPQLPNSSEYDDFDTDWDNEIPQPQLVYNDYPPRDIEAYDELHEEAYIEAEQLPESPVLLNDSPSPITGTLSREDVIQGIADEASSETALPPIVSTSADDLEQDLDGTPLEITDSVTESYPWFNKRPASKSEFTDGPVIISPDGAVQSSDSLSD